MLPDKKNYFIIGTGIFFSIIFIGLIFLLKPKKLPPPPQIYPHQVSISSGTISEGDSLYNILVNEGFSSENILHLQRSFKEVFDPRKFKPGDTYEVVRSTSGVFMCFRYYPDPLRFYVVEKSPENGFTAFSKQKPLEKTIAGKKIEIKTSLWDAIIESGENPEIAVRLADIFAWQIDFLTELRQGDIFRFIFERYSIDGNQAVIYGEILAVQYQGVSGNTYNAIFFEDKEGRQDYYTLEGASLRRQFLRAPLNYRRISSYFSRNRFHPILRYYRPHLGIDYAAPEGTPVVSVGDGTVIFKGLEGQNGNLVIIRHNSVYTTTYGHLSRFAKNIKRGDRVKQGQMIGYVGMTGLATGPHLDFRIKKNGQFVNFLKLNLPSASKIKDIYKEDFNLIKKEYLTQMIALSDQGIEISQATKK